MNICYKVKKGSSIIFLLKEKKLTEKESNTLDLLKQYLCSKGKEGFDGYKLGIDGINYFKVEDYQIVEPSATEVKNARKYLMKVMDKEEPSSKIIGFLDENKGDKEIVFKIRDKRTEGKKRTQKKTGTICRNQGMLKGKVIGLIEVK